jgi:glycine cleavage system H protein
MPDVPESLRFSNDHLWVGPPQDTVVEIGITDYAQQSLGDAIDIRPPETNAAITAGDPCGEIESTKSVSDLIAPVTGTVESRNEELLEAPDLVNSAPYGQGWIITVRVAPRTLDDQLARLMDARAYRDLTGE